MIRHYCDWCQSEANNAQELTSVSLEDIDNASNRFNRNDSYRWSHGVEGEICLACRLAVLNTIKERKELAAKPKN